MSIPFKFHVPFSCWQKSGDDYPMRVGGIVSTDDLDRQQEVVVQDGLNFNSFLKHGWFNDNHGQKTTDVLGYPTGAKRVKKGERLPNGSTSRSNGWWTEGYLINTPSGRKIYELCTALQKTDGGRRIGFSIEGQVLKRDKSNKKIISADVRNVAITHCPVNTSTEMTALVKALKAGSAVTAQESDRSSPGDGFPIRSESLDSHLFDISEIEKKKKKKKKDKNDDSVLISKSVARIIVASIKPKLNSKQISLIIDQASLYGS